MKKEKKKHEMDCIYCGERVYVTKASHGFEPINRDESNKIIVGAYHFKCKYGDSEED